MKKTNVIAGLIIFIILISINLIYNYNKKTEQDKIDYDKGISVGVIIEYDRWSTANYGAKYEFYVNDKKYFGKESLAPYFKDCIKDSSCIGRKFVVEYWKKDPSINRILFDKEIKD